MEEKYVQKKWVINKYKNTPVGLLTAAPINIAVFTPSDDSKEAYELFEKFKNNVIEAYNEIPNETPRYKEKGYGIDFILKKFIPITAEKDPMGFENIQLIEPTKSKFMLVYKSWLGFMKEKDFSTIIEKFCEGSTKKINVSYETFIRHGNVRISFVSEKFHKYALTMFLRKIPSEFTVYNPEELEKDGLLRKDDMHRDIVNIFANSENSLIETISKYIMPIDSEDDLFTIIRKLDSYMTNSGNHFRFNQFIHNK